ncbi:hypothetical protein AB0M92_36720 [Streptomyces sp. NPDC051582]
MDSELSVIVYPPDAQGGRRIRVDGRSSAALLDPAAQGGVILAKCPI